MTDMSQILAEGLNHHPMVYGLNPHKLKDKVVGHQSTNWRTMEDCFSNICAVSAGYKRAKDYSRAYFHTPEVPINEFKSIKEAGPCFKCGRPYSQSRCTKSKRCLNEKF